ncbi:MAG: sigma-70 family RNA polymerase sigma factor [Bacteroidetes bacterium]|nr:MAG: sigma-70 family RNA polymerase sigma factor [Bacteroidota bacterium]
MSNHSFTDLELIEGIRNSDERKLSYLYQNYLPGIVRYVTQNSGKEADAHDMFQEALIVLFRKVRQEDFQLTASLQAYLYSICRHLWLKHIRDSRLGKKSEIQEYDAVDLDADTTEEITKSGRMRLFRHYFKLLDEKCRTILELYFEKIPMREIAQRLDTTEGYVKKRKFVCKNKLIEMIRKDHRYQELAFGEYQT